MGTTNTKLTLLQLTHTIADTVREVGEMPSGHLYAAVMDQYDLNLYNTCVELLIRSNLIKRLPSHLLVWTGPPKEKVCRQQT